MTSNDISSKFCSNCGGILPPTVSAPAATLEDTDTPHDSNAYYKAIIGPKNQDYYLNQFTKLDKGLSKGGSWHWPAFFMTFFWLLYRKMWLNALIYFFLPYLVLIPLGIASAIFGDSTEAAVGIGYLLFIVATYVLPPMYANALYHAHCKKKIVEMRESSKQFQRQLGELSGKGGTSNVAIFLMLFLVFISLVGVLAAIALPAYQDYTTRARISGALSIGNGATASVEAYYYQHEEIPGSLEQAGFSTPITNDIGSISLNSENGSVVVTMATDPVRKKSFVLTPSLDANKKIVWTCSSQDIQSKYLPQQCRQ